jgi:hypothetical protein
MMEQRTAGGGEGTSDRGKHVRAERTHRGRATTDRNLRLGRSLRSAESRGRRASLRRTNPPLPRGTTVRKSPPDRFTGWKPVPQGGDPPARRRCHTNAAFGLQRSAFSHGRLCRRRQMRQACGETPTPHQSTGWKPMPQRRNPPARRRCHTKAAFSLQRSAFSQRASAAGALTGGLQGSPVGNRCHMFTGYKPVPQGQVPEGRCYTTR